MKRILLSLLVVCCCMMLHAAKANKKVTITVGNDTREYWLYVPNNVTDNAPLVLSLHGAGGHDTDKSPFRTDVADKEGCIVAGEGGFPIIFYEIDGMGRIQNHLHTPIEERRNHRQQHRHLYQIQRRNGNPVNLRQPRQGTLFPRHDARCCLCPARPQSCHPHTKRHLYQKRQEVYSKIKTLKQKRPIEVFQKSEVFLKTATAATIPEKMQLLLLYI